ncbi:hypothetical protein K3X48_04205 [Aliiroseovarius crassostreae]|uniref:Uncharacterized protein n=1 Tax=Aliiroseovarius crassostreae TaxID=154981 RepID=A0A9Q9M040_9RHOB|nr:hypothetical protein [Aliiroseovarius crassostreae]UWP96199.1 hypothetical protein K3X48_04205 [Aliiroseovarius crassostreae]
MVRFEEAEAARFFDTPHLVEFAGEQVEVVVSVVEESASGQPVGGSQTSSLRFADTFQYPSAAFETQFSSPQLRVDTAEAEHAHIWLHF